MYDKDNSGEIDLDEMVEIFCLMYAVQVLFRISLKAPLSFIFQGFFRIFENILILNISRDFQKPRPQRGRKRFSTLWTGEKYLEII